MGKRGHGEGSVYKDEKRDRWVAAVSVAGKRKVARCHTKKEAVEALKQLQREADQGTLTIETPTRVEAHLRQWLEAKTPGLKPSTWRHYELGMSVFMVICQVRVHKNLPVAPSQ